VASYGHVLLPADVQVTAARLCQNDDIVVFVDFVHVVLLHSSQFVDQSVGSVKHVPSCGHVLRFADVQVSAVVPRLNDVLVKSVVPIYVVSLHLRQFEGECGMDNHQTLFNYLYGLLYRGSYRMFHVLLCVTYICAVLLHGMYCANTAGLIHCIHFMHPALLVHHIVLCPLRCINFQHNLLFIRRLFLHYMTHIMSFVSRALGHVCHLHNIQSPCCEFACLCSLFWVSVVCVFLLPIHFILSYFCGALRYSGSFTVLKEISILHGRVHHGIDGTDENLHILLPYSGGGQHKFAFDVLRSQLCMTIFFFLVT